MRRFTLLSTLVVISIALLAGMLQMPKSKPVVITEQTKHHYPNHRTTACKEQSVKATGVITSYEAQNQNGTLSLQWQLTAFDTLWIDSLVINAPAMFGFSINNVSGLTHPGSVYSTVYLLPGQMATCTASVSYNTATLPYYPKQIQIISYLHGNNAAIGGAATATGMVYFTPYTTTEIWDLADFEQLPRVWETEQTPEPARVSIAQNAIPQSTKPAESSITETWQQNYSLAYTEGLPYAVQMEAHHPDSILAEQMRDSIEEASLTPSLIDVRYRGKVSGRLTSDIINDNGQPKTIGLKGIKVVLFDRDVFSFDDEFTSGYTDINGYFELWYDKYQDATEDLQEVELYLQFITQNNNAQVTVIRPDLVKYINEDPYDRTSHQKTVAKGNQETDFGTMMLGDEFKILHWANLAVDFLNGQVGTFSREDLKIYPHQSSSNCKSAPYQHINLEPEDVNHETVIWHEFGHYVMLNLSGISPFVLAGFGEHSSSYESVNSALAWSEGWATGFMAMLDQFYQDIDEEYGLYSFTQGNASGTAYNIENRNRRQLNEGAVSNGLRSEYHIACAIYDLYDGAGKFPENTTTANFNDAPEEGTGTSLSNTGYNPGFEDDVELTAAQVFKPLIDAKNGNYGITTVTSYFEKLLETNGHCNANAIQKVFTQNGVLNNTANQETLTNQLSTDLISNLQVDYEEGLATVLFAHIYKVDINELNGPTNNYNFIPATNYQNDHISDPLIIRNGATLGINNNFGATTDNTNMFVEICNNSVTIDDGGILEVGGTLKGGALILNEGATLYIKNNGNLKLQYGCKLIINNGSKLVFENGAGLFINELGYIEVKPGGKIEIAENATFTWSGKGYLKINTNTWGVSNIVATGPNAKFYKAGAGFSPFDEKLIEIVGGGILNRGSLSVDKSLAEFKLHRGYVLMGENTLLDVESKMKCTFVKFTSNDIDKKHAGIMVYGQQNEAYLDNCIVENAGWGILMLNNSGPATQAKIVATKFINNDIGVYIQGKGADLSYCTFWNNKGAAIQFDMLTLPAKLYKINAESNGYGLLANTTSYSLINITESKIYQNYTGVQVTGSTLTIGCSKVYNNIRPNVSAKNLTTLGLEPARWANSGNNYFYNDITTSIELDKAWDLFIDKGKNHFQVNTNNNSQAIHGQFMDATEWWQRRYFPILGNQNYWNTNGTSPVMQTNIAANDYFITQKYLSNTANIPIVDATPLTTAPTFTDCSSGTGLPYNSGDQPSVLIGKPNLTLSNTIDVKDYFMTGMNKLYISNDYEGAISIFELIVKHNYSTNNEILLPNGDYVSEQGLWKDVVYAAYEKMLESLTTGIYAEKIGDYKTDSEPYENVLLTQEYLIENMILSDTLAYEHWFKVSLDNALIYKLMNKLDDCIGKISTLQTFNNHTTINTNLLDFNYCATKNEINLRDSIITKMEYAVATTNCSSVLDYTYPTKTLDVGVEPADPSEENYYGKKANDKNNTNTLPNITDVELSSSDVSVYPNPSNGDVFINTNGVKIASINLYNKLGIKLATYTNTDKITINQSGLYILEIKTDVKTYRKKVIVQ